MGLDFIRLTAPVFTRALDRRAIEMRTPKLFGRDMAIVSRTAIADICGGAEVMVGERILLRMMKDKIVAQRGNLVIAECVSPPAEFVAHLNSGAGVARGEIKSLQPISQTVEIGICD
ncbi:hypothetical protein [Bradyrhizobium sp. G127]|jgi:hypothetical protein|uniref:hypothetical protein n=1 Tax=Bradyrhizobium sp. G127 TaxID=2904800 RepID=UPI001BC5278B|nr:hypothetical protein [Bradyrhizobium sp. G127]MBS4004955.1 hypothetical protein [Afipia sp.]MCF2521647.1 hypothetical protein [Bradyrhizobium sp. G127]